MRATFQNAGMVLSIGVFFSLMVAGLSSSLPHTLSTRTDRAGRAGRRRAAGRRACRRSARCSPRSSATTRSSSCSARHLLGTLPAANAATLTGREFFPDLISGPFHDGLAVVFVLAIVHGPGRRGRLADPVEGDRAGRADVGPLTSRVCP